MLADIIPEPERMSVLLIQIKCYTSPRSPNSEADLCSVSMTRSQTTVTAVGKESDWLNDDLNYISLLIEVGPHAGGDHRCNVFSRARLQSLGELDLKQFSLSINGLRPSALLHPDTLGYQNIDNVFDQMMTEHFNPMKLKDSSQDALNNLSSSIGLVYKS